MRTGVIQYTIGRLLWFTVASLAAPAGVSIAYGESRWWAFAGPAALAAIAAVVFTRLPAARAAATQSLHRREGFFMVVLAWMLLVVFLAVAYVLTGEFPSFADAFFESMSGYTTTGATIFETSAKSLHGELVGVEALPASVLFARSFSHWIGGMGIIVLSVAILPKLAVGGLQLFSAESSGIDAEKLAPRIAATARRLWVLYFTITALLMALLLPSMPVFDAINHAMSTIATGGFSTKNASIAHYDSIYVELILIAFMFASGISFTLQYRAFFGRNLGALWQSPEARLFTGITMSAIILITINLLVTSDRGIAEVLRTASFQTVSVITTTGFATEEFDAWPHFSRLLLVGLMLIGGCAGSTAGGSKVVRLYVVIKYAGIQLRRLVRPRLVETLTIGNREVSRETTEGIMGYYLMFFAAIMTGYLFMTALGLDFVSGTTASVSVMNSIGPGLGTVNGTVGFGDVPAAGKYLLSFGMLLARLEIYTIIVLFIPHFWRRG